MVGPEILVALISTLFHFIISLFKLTSKFRLELLPHFLAVSGGYLERLNVLGDFLVVEVPLLGRKIFDVVNHLLHY